MESFIEFFDKIWKVKVTWHIAKYGDPYSEFVLCIYPSKCTSYTHIVNTHPEHFYAAAPGEQLRFQCLAQGHLVVVLRVERALYIHSPHRQSLLARNSNSQPFDYESDSLTHWSQTQFLEGHSSAQICSNPNQTHLIQLIKVFRITRNFQAGVIWS